VAPSGAVEAAVGLMGSGQGYETSLAQAVAEGLGVAAETVRLHTGNTDTAPYGMGSRGARGGTAGGSVLLLAARTVQRKVCAIAATRLGLNSEMSCGCGMETYSGRSPEDGRIPGCAWQISPAWPTWIR